MLGLFTPDLRDDGLVGRGDFESFEGIFAAFFGGVRGDIGKLCEKEIWPAGSYDDLPKNYVRDAFHGGED